jgi:hypothetical protein
MQSVGDTMKLEGMKSRVGEHHLQGADRGRVALSGGMDISDDLF